LEVFWDEKKKNKSAAFQRKNTVIG
jgi:hypothetical protein